MPRADIYRSRYSVWTLLAVYPLLIRYYSLGKGNGRGKSMVLDSMRNMIDKNIISYKENQSYLVTFCHSLGNSLVGHRGPGAKTERVIIAPIAQLG